ncbi:PP2C family protein-serine/threonine phosphatase [Dictyobacter formicarum]|uniref:PPM-type phosphatase domain-containing protein n=1 Tax=Dictyobacter formicarum TaxID=2778368 RepID=A0ABQ3VUQ6_9CHLR|nr:protein phosphatase 2C domain-containing protein [Dictyobacter formicarum]GHO89419.1 hypothetical protein KSZ_74250 [Dictyobacter formicarum]
MNKGMPTSVTYAVGARSDPGKRKMLNEDSLFAVSGSYNTSLMPFGLFIVADGMGGYANGQDASSRAIQVIADHVLPNMTGTHTLQPDECSHLLAEAMQRANTAVRQQNIDLHSKEGVDIDVSVSTTVTAALVVGLTAYIAHVGNCRLYRYHPGEKLFKVTTDHLWWRA